VRPAGTRSEPAPGVVVYDVGQNLTGWARIRVSAPAGTAIEAYYGEQLTADGRVTDKNVLAGEPPTGFALVGGQLQTDYYIAKGTGEEAWAPRFTYKGFQYVQLSAPGGQPLPAGVSVSVQRIEQVRTDLRRTSTFAAGNALLERIHRNTEWAVQNNVHSVVTDTPQLEKNAWTGDAQLIAPTEALLFDTERLTQKQVQDMLDAQTDAGEVPLLAPSNENYGYVGKPAFKPPECCGATPAWDAFWFVVPWEAYQRYGDRRTLERTYPAMRKYLDEWIPRWTDKDGDAFAYTLTSGLGDWDPPTGTPTNIELASTAYYAHFADVAADVARVLGRPADAARYDELFAAIRADFNAKFLGADGVYRNAPSDPFTHTAQVLPLAFGLAPSERRAELAARVADDIRANRGGNAYVGILGARSILPVLTAAGHADVAYTVATQTDYPSWGYWVDVLGWTSLGEYWEETSRSRNHHFFGTIVQWLYEDLAGIRALEPGYRRIEFKPTIPAGLDHAAATYDSVRGTVATRWHRTASGLALDVTVPATATGVVHVPAGDPRDVTVHGGRLIGVAGGRVVYAVGAGRHHFRVAE
jgi:alpha-L-rhamnosidase